jgi:hypothetical protein
LGPTLIHWGTEQQQKEPKLPKSPSPDNIINERAAGKRLNAIFSAAGTYYLTDIAR